MAFGASIALQVAALEAAAETATITLVVNRAVKATPVAIDEIALRIKTSPWTELNGRVALVAACPRLT
jgi:hypothetical protein